MRVLKRKKGFTLTELLATVAVMVIVLTIAVPLYNTVRENTLNSSYSNLVAYIESKAQNYANDTGAVLTNVDTLIKEGYLQADDDKSNIYDPRTNEVLNCYMIMIVKKDGELIATLDEDGPVQNSDGTCDVEKIIASSIKILCNGKDCSNEWYNNDLTLSVDLSKVEDQSKIEYYWANTLGFTSQEDRVVIKVDNSGVLNTIYTVTVKNVGQGSQSVKVDKESPIILDSTNISNEFVWTTSKTIKVDATDLSGSGIAGYGFINQNQNCSTDPKNSMYQTSNKKTYTTSGNYKVCVIDKVGNLVSELFNIQKIDTSTPGKPTISASDGIASGGWHTKEFDLTFNSTKNGPSQLRYYYGTSESQINTLGSTTHISSIYSGKTIYVKTCTEAGKCSQVSQYVVKYDTTAPKYSSGGSLGPGTISRPTYVEDNGGSGGTKVYTCVTTSSTAPAKTDKCFNMLSTYTNTCGVTYYLYSYAVDALGNTSAVKKHSGSYNKACPKPPTSSGSSGSGSSSGSSSSKYDDDDDDDDDDYRDTNPPKKTSGSSSSCDVTCQMEKNSDKWNEVDQDDSLSKEEKDKLKKELADANAKLAEENEDCGNGCRRDDNGYWIIIDTGSKLYDPNEDKKSSSSDKDDSSSSNKNSSSSGSSSSNTVKDVFDRVGKLFGKWW
ncbi:MAG: prepilin-type N-terminal cleavage/methylation domain-containing protein [Firmicutes bacterium]|nr:prepilin-type N-terminal cleavage/methylation domain-containing protein [Bacillota bacterium]